MCFAIGILKYNKHKKNLNSKPQTPQAMYLLEQIE